MSSDFCDYKTENEHEHNILIFFRNNLAITGTLFLVSILLVIYFFKTKYLKTKIVFIVLSVYYLLPLFIWSIVEYSKAKNAKCKNYIKFNHNACKELENEKKDKKHLKKSRNIFITFLIIVIFLSVIMMVLLYNVDLNLLGSKNKKAINSKTNKTIIRSLDYRHYRHYRFTTYYNMLKEYKINNPISNALFHWRRGSLASLPLFFIFIFNIYWYIYYLAYQISCNKILN